MSIPPYGRFPLNNTTPFTFRDSYTFLELLNEFLETVDTVEKNEIEFKKAVNAALAEGKKAADDFMADMTTKYQTILSQLIGYTIEVGEDTYRASMMDGSVFEAYTITGVDNKLLIVNNQMTELSEDVNNSLAEAAAFNEQTYTPIDTNVTRLGNGTMPNHNGTIAVDGGIVAIGRNALNQVEAGDKSVAIGSNAMRLSKKVHDDIAIGDSALRNVTSETTSYTSSSPGTRNIGIGGNAGRHVIQGTQHTIIGRNAGQNIVGGAGSVVIGNGAMAGRCPVGLSGGVENWAPAYPADAENVNVVAVGNWAGSKNLARDMTALGAYALSNNIQSFANTALGTNALRRINDDRWLNGDVYEEKGGLSGTYSQNGYTLALTIPNHGCAVNDVVIFSLTGGESDTSFMGEAVDVFGRVVNATGTQIFINHPKSRNTSGSAKLTGRAIAGSAPPNCNNNTAVGSTVAAYMVKDSYSNTLVGHNVGMNLTKGVNNTFVGQNSASSGGVFAEYLNGVEINNSTTLGQATLFNLKTGNDDNTAIGYRAGFRLENGTNNVMVGNNAGSLSVTGHGATGYSNCVALGADSRISGDNQVQLGGPGSVPMAYQEIQLRSDARDKTDIADTALGLDFINQLRPVDYRYDFRDKYEGGNRDGSKAGKRLHHGFIAQEIAEIDYDFGGYQDHTINGGDDVLSLGYNEFIAPLVKAVQQLSAEVARLSALVNE